MTALANANKIAREFIANGAVPVNVEKVSDTAAKLAWEQAFFGRFFLLKRGKKLFHLGYREIP